MFRNLNSIRWFLKVVSSLNSDDRTSWPSDSGRRRFIKAVLFIVRRSWNSLVYLFSLLMMTLSSPKIIPFKKRAMSKPMERKKVWAEVLGLWSLPPMRLTDM